MSQFCPCQSHAEMEKIEQARVVKRKGAVRQARRRVFCALSTVAALVLSLAAADILLSSLLDSIAVAAGMLAFRMPAIPREPPRDGRVRIAGSGAENTGMRYIGVHNLN